MSNIDLQELRKKGVEGKTGFSIKCDDTLQNNNIHNRFKLFCKEETANDYTAGLSWLMDRLENLSIIQEMHERIVELEQRMALVEAREAADKVAKDTVEDNGTF